MTEFDPLQGRGLVKSAFTQSVDALAELVERESSAELRRTMYVVSKAAQAGRQATLGDHQLWLTSLLTDGNGRYKSLPGVLLGANAPSQ